MGTLWLGGAEGLIAQNFTQITGADTGFPEGGDFTSTPPPWTLSAWRHPPSGKLKNTPLPPLLLPKKRTTAAQKTELPKSWGGGGAAAPPAPPPHTPMTMSIPIWPKFWVLVDGLHRLHLPGPCVCHYRPVIYSIATVVQEGQRWNIRQCRLELGRIEYVITVWQASLDLSVAQCPNVPLE